MLRFLSALLAVTALAVAGCGSDDSKSDSTSSSTAATSTPAAAGDVVEIHLKNIQFSPVDATAKVGETVKWINDDAVDHNVVGGPLKSDIFGQGATYEFKATTAGKIDYVCTLHSNMKATLTVQ